MTEDDQLLFDEMSNYRELAASFNRQADNHEQSAREMRAVAQSYTDRANVIAVQLGLTT